MGARVAGKTSTGTDDSRRRFRSGVFIADWWLQAASILIVLGSGPSGFGGAGGGVPSGGSPMLPVKAFAAGINTPMPVCIVPPTLYDEGGRGCSGPKLSEMPGAVHVRGGAMELAKEAHCGHAHQVSREPP